MRQRTRALLGSLAAALIVSIAPAGASADTYWQCVPFARLISGIQIFGDAYTWWRQAVGKYETGFTPRAGAVLCFKPTGKMREIKKLDRVGDLVKDSIRDMILHYGTPMPTPGETVKKPEKIEDVKELYGMDSLRADIYQFWGYRFDYKPKEAKKPKKEKPKAAVTTPSTKNAVRTASRT